MNLYNRAFVFMAAADMMFRRMMDISEGNIRLHGMREVEANWRAYQVPPSVSAEVEGMLASWVSDVTGPAEERDFVYAILLPTAHRWNNRDARGGSHE